MKANQVAEAVSCVCDAWVPALAHNEAFKAIASMHSSEEDKAQPWWRTAMREPLSAIREKHVRAATQQALHAGGAPAWGTAHLSALQLCVGCPHC